MAENGDGFVAEVAAAVDVAKGGVAVGTGVAVGEEGDAGAWSREG